MTSHRTSVSFIFVWLALACGGPLQYKVPSTAAAPGADASISAEVLEEQNQTQLEIEIKNLAPPSRVEPSSKHFVSWYRLDARDAWARIAALDYDADSREGKMTSSVPLVHFVFQITAEPNVDAASPSSSVVLSQAIGNK